MKSQTQRASLFLLELVIDLFLFVLCAAICVGLFLHARSISMESNRLTAAVYIAQSAAENLRNGNRPASEQDGYEIVTRETPGDGTTGFSVTVLRGEKEIYTLTGAYPPEVQP